MAEVKEVKVKNNKRDMGKYFKEVKAELKKVTWPSKAQLINNTVTVIAACIIIGLVIWVFDVGLSWVYKNVLFTNK